MDSGEPEENIVINNEVSVSEEKRSCNPNLTKNLDPVDEEKMKGDAIGDTLYSERFVLKTMMTLADITKENNEFKWCEDFENDLCTLWDMTTEKDVVFFLLEHDFVELSLSVIRNSEEIRLTEIMVGIVGNMCVFHESCEKIFQCEFEIFLSLINVTDTPLLVQLMRLLKSLLYDDAKHIDLIITGDVISQIKFFLTSSQNSELLLYTLQTFELVVDKKKLDVLCENTILGVDEAFKQMFKNISDSHGFLSHEHEKIITTYLKVIQNISLSIEEVQNDQKLLELSPYLQNNIENTYANFGKILTLFCDVEPFISTPENMEFYLFCIVQFLNLVTEPFSIEILKLFLKIFDVILKEKIKFDEDILNDLVDLICKMIKIGNEKVLKVLFDEDKENVLKLLKEKVVKRKTNNCDKDYLDKLNQLISL